jgi:hypothetical protein
VSRPPSLTKVRKTKNGLIGQIARRDIAMKTKHSTIAGMLNQIVDNPVDFFRSVETLVVENKGLYGAAWIGFVKNGNDATQLPAADTTYLRKFVVTKGERYNSNGFILGNNYVSNTIIAAIFGAIDPAKLETPKDGHLRWTAAAPNTEKLVGYLHHENYTMEINPNTLKFDGPAMDMQCVKVGNNYAMHILTKKGTVYATSVKPQDIFGNIVPSFTKAHEKVTSLLTVPFKNEVAMFLGTENGIFFNNDTIKNTHGQHVTTLVMDSEQNRIYYKTIDNRIFAIGFNDDFQIRTFPTIVNDNVVTENFDWILAGPSLMDDNTPAIMLSTWKKTDDGRQYTHIKKLVPITLNFNGISQ